MRHLTSIIMPLVAASLAATLAASALADMHTERRSKPRSAAPARSEQRPAEAAELSALPDGVQEVIELTNRERLKAGLPALKRQKNLQESAMWMAGDMARRRYFDHTNSSGRDLTDRLEGFRYADYRAIGENI